MEVKHQSRSTSVQSIASNNSRTRYSNKARQYQSRRRNNNNNNNNHNLANRRRRSQRLSIKHIDPEETASHPPSIQTPIIINGCDGPDIQICHAYHPEPNVVEIHGSQSPAFMPSAQYVPLQATHTKYVQYIYSINLSQSVYPESLLYTI